MHVNHMETDGYNAIMGEWRTAFDGGDPWGSNIGHLFGLADVFYVATGECLPEYRPSPFLDNKSIEDLTESDDYPTDIYASMVVNEEIETEDIRRAFTILSRYDDWCRRDGRNY